MKIIEWFKKLFREHPSKRTIVMEWSAVGVMPNGGSFNMPSGLGGKAVYDGVLPGLQPIPAVCVGKELSVTINPPPKGGASVLLYKYLQDGKTWIPGWCPSLDFGPGVGRMGMDLSAYTFSPGESLQAWGGYAVGLEANTGPIDIRALVTLTKTPPAPPPAG